MRALPDLGFSDYPLLLKRIFPGPKTFANSVPGSARARARRAPFFARCLCSQLWPERGLHFGKQCPAPATQDQLRAKLGQGWPNFASNVDRNLSTLGQLYANLGQLWPIRPNYGPNCVKLGPIVAELAQICSSAGGSAAWTGAAHERHVSDRCSTCAAQPRNEATETRSPGSGTHLASAGKQKEETVVPRGIAAGRIAGMACHRENLALFRVGGEGERSC